jgi:hypothetical protein
MHDHLLEDWIGFVGGRFGFGYEKCELSEGIVVFYCNKDYFGEIDSTKFLPFYKQFRRRQLENGGGTKLELK